MRMKLATLALAAALAAPLSASADDLGEKHFKVRRNMGFDFMYDTANLGAGMRTIPVHPDDGGFLYGDTMTRDCKGFDFTPKLGLEVGVGGSKATVVAGADARFHLAWINNNYHDGIYDVRKQSSDTRSDNSSAYVYSMIRPGPFSVTPYAGLELSLSSGLAFRVEVGLPYSSFKATSGHDRFGEWSPAKEDSWSGFGKAARLGFRIGDWSDNGVFTITIGVEEYKTKFLGDAGKVRSYSAALGWKIDL
ncbi:hypothetical protein JW711_04220 [Candidatus Woesearchaeota archaeon]|nr:hypothetical protein [Candidatus Woesearchaeota archaeon]